MNVPFVLVCLAIIALLSYMAYRRVQAINARIAELDEERAQPVGPVLRADGAVPPARGVQAWQAGVGRA
jgi:hypothetical protein